MVPTSSRDMTEFVTFVQSFESLGNSSEVALHQGKHVLRHTWKEGLCFSVLMILNYDVLSEEQMKHRQNNKPYWSVFGFLVTRSSLVCWYLYDANNLQVPGSLFSKYVVISTEELD